MKQKSILYNSLVTNHFTYGDIIWNNCGVINRNTIQLAQNSAARSMIGTINNILSIKALKTLELLTIREKRKIHAFIVQH